MGLEPTAPRAGLTSGALLILAFGRDLLVTRFLARGGRLRRMTFAILFLPRVLTRRFEVCPEASSYDLCHIILNYISNKSLTLPLINSFIPWQLNERKLDQAAGNKRKEGLIKTDVFLDSGAIDVDWYLTGDPH